MRALVTGGAGFIGSHLVDRLVELGWSVVVVDDLSLGKEENINRGAVFVKRSILDNLDDVFSKGFDAVFHVAALPRVQFSIAQPRETHEVNVNGTLHLLDLCRKHGVRRFVFSSSSSVYGDQDKLPLKETMETKPMSPYALHKLIGENYCALYYKLYGLETLSLRYFNVYGKRQSAEGGYACLIPKFIHSFKQGNSPTIFGDGEQTRDFTHVSDVVEANIASVLTLNGKGFGKTFNIGAGNQISVNKVTGEIKKLLNSNVEAMHGPAVIEPRDTFADISLSKEMLNWSPKVGFEDGLRKTVFGDK